MAKATQSTTKTSAKILDKNAAKSPVKPPVKSLVKSPSKSRAKASNETGGKSERALYRNINRELEREVESNNEDEDAASSAATLWSSHSQSAPPPQPLSVKEKSVLEFLEVYISTQGVSPTYSEICKHFGFASFNSVQRYLKQLEVKGYIRLPWANQKRAITLLHASSAIQDAIQGGVNLNNLNSISPRSVSKSLGSSKSISQAGGNSSGLSGSTSGNVIPMGSSTENFSLPLLGRVAAGSPIEAMEYDEFIDVPASLVRYADRTYALRVQGQSMIDDGILDGDVILVQRQSSAINGEIVVAMVGEEATVKRFYMHRGAATATQFASAANDFDEDLNDASYDEAKNSERFKQGPGKKIELRPANSTMQSMWFEPSEIQIRGIVVGLIRKFF